nr:MAG TPA: Repressor protein CI [Caudoviricetes sp.]
MDYRLDSKKISEKLGNLRLKKNVSQSQVAESLGITKAAVSQYESGQRIPSDEVKIKLSNYYGVSVQDLFYTF